MGHRGTILITFASPSPPREVFYWSFRRSVRQYEQRALVCLRCHRPGHKAATCPAGAAMCGKCSKQHGETPDDCSSNGKKYCVRCKHVGHLAIEPECLAKANYGKNCKNGNHPEQLPTPGSRQSTNITQGETLPEWTQPAQLQ